MESKFTGVYINLLRSRQLHVIYIVITLLLLYSVGAHDAFICEKGGGGSVELSLRFIISSPTWPVLCCSVTSDLNLDILGYQSLGVPHLPPFIWFFIGLCGRPTHLSCMPRVVGYEDVRPSYFVYFLPQFCLCY